LGIKYGLGKMRGHEEGLGDLHNPSGPPILPPPSTLQLVSICPTRGEFHRAGHRQLHHALHWQLYRSPDDLRLVWPLHRRYPLLGKRRSGLFRLPRREVRDSYNLRDLWPLSPDGTPIVGNGDRKAIGQAPNPGFRDTPDRRGERSPPRTLKGIAVKSA